MKSLLIETVTNGWIVKAYERLDPCCSTAYDMVAVYNKVEDLQAALPALLIEPKIKKTEPTY